MQCGLGILVGQLDAWANGIKIRVPPNGSACPAD